MKQNESSLNERTPSQASCFISPSFATAGPAADIPGSERSWENEL